MCVLQSHTTRYGVYRHLHGTIQGSIFLVWREREQKRETHAGVNGFSGFSHCLRFDLPGGNLSTDQRRILFPISPASLLIYAAISNQDTDCCEIM